MAYVEVLPLPSAYLMPSKGTLAKARRVRVMNLDGTPDFGGYGSEDESPTLRKGMFGSVAKSSSRWTGDRDESRKLLYFQVSSFFLTLTLQAPLEKLISLLDDIFEAEDSLPPDVSDTADLSQDYSSHLTTDCSRPLVTSNIIRKLTNYIGHVARPAKRDMSKTTSGGGALNTPKGRMTEIETQALSRLLKMLERSVKTGEDLDPFATGSGGREGTASPRKNKTRSKKAEKGAKSQMPNEEEEDVVMEVANENHGELQREQLQEM